jgi:threonine/homoserine/homoserine lactone efflux protein
VGWFPGDTEDAGRSRRVLAFLAWALIYAMVGMVAAYLIAYSVRQDRTPATPTRYGTTAATTTGG